MTREEAIRQLDGADIAVLNRDFFKFNQAIIMAISALRQQGVPGKNVGNNDPLTLDDAIAHLDDTLSDTGRKWSCESCRMEHVQLRAWLAELRDIKQERNAPLTLDELMQMSGEPVWIVEYPDWGHWELSADAEDYVTDREPGFYGMKHNDPAGRYGLHKLGWLAYRQKPEEDDCEH